MQKQQSTLITTDEYLEIFNFIAENGLDSVVELSDAVKSKNINDIIANITKLAKTNEKVINFFLKIRIDFYIGITHFVEQLKNEKRDISDYIKIVQYLKSMGINIITLENQECINRWSGYTYEFENEV